MRWRLAHKPRQWKGDWLTNHYNERKTGSKSNERGIGWQTAKRRQILAHRAIIAGSRRPCSNSFLDYQNMFCTIVSVYIRWLSWPWTLVTHWVTWSPKMQGSNYCHRYNVTGPLGGPWSTIFWDTLFARKISFGKVRLLQKCPLSLFVWSS